jgi:hypothetical protein
MANTRNRNTHANAKNNGENINDANPSPSPLPTLEQVPAIQSQMLHTMQYTMVNIQNAQP